MKRKRPQKKVKKVQSKSVTVPDAPAWPADVYSDGPGGTGLGVLRDQASDEYAEEAHEITFDIDAGTGGDGDSQLVTPLLVSPTVVQASRGVPGARSAVFLQQSRESFAAD